MRRPTKAHALPTRPPAPPRARRWEPGLLTSCVLCGLAIGSFAPVASAAIHVWTGNSPSTPNWSSSLNWDPSDGVPPNDGSASVQFLSQSPPPVQTTSFVNAPWSIRQLVFATAQGLLGSALTVGDMGIHAQDTVSIENNIVVGSNQTWIAQNLFGSPVVLTINGDVALGLHELVLATVQGNIAITGVISGPGFLRKAGTRTLTLSGANTYSGVTLIVSGTLRSGASNVIPAATLLMEGGTLDLTGFSETVGPGAVAETGLSFSGSGSAAAHVVIGTSLGISTLGKFIEFTASRKAVADIAGGPLGLGTTSNTREIYVEDSPTLASELTIESAIINPGGTVGTAPVLRKTGAGRLVLAGSNSFPRSVEVLVGDLRITSGGALGVGGSSNDRTHVYEGATLELSGGITVATEHLDLRGDGGGPGALISVDGENHWNGPVALTDADIGVASGSTLHIGGAMGGPSTLRKRGAGTLVLENASTYIFPTGVLEGTLQVENLSGSATGAAPVTVFGGATLAGSGIIGGGVDILSLGTLSPGTSTGVLRVGSLTLDPNATTRMEVRGPSPLFKNDKVEAVTSVAFGGLLEVALTGGFEPSLGDECVLFTYGSHTGTFDLLSLPSLAAGLHWHVEYGPTAMSVSVSDTPELDVDESLPLVHALDAPAPNPSRASVAMTYDVAEGAMVSVLAYDISGREVARPVEPAWTPPGRYSVSWTGTDRSGRPLAAGTYYLRLLVNGQPVGRARTVQRLR